MNKLAKRMLQELDLEIYEGFVAYQCICYFLYYPIKFYIKFSCRDYIIDDVSFRYSIGGMPPSNYDIVFISVYKDFIKCRCDKYNGHQYERDLQQSINENFESIFTKLKLLDALFNLGFDFSKTYAETILENTKIRIISPMLDSSPFMVRGGIL